MGDGHDKLYMENCSYLTQKQFQFISIPALVVDKEWPLTGTLTFICFASRLKYTMHQVFKFDFVYQHIPAKEKH
jgi:hypothetical protein